MDVKTIKKRSLIGIGSLTLQRVVLRVVSFGGEVLLARILAPEIFGIFAIVSFIINFLGIFGDLGLGAALIQKKEKIDKNDLKTTFTVQIILVGSITFLLFLLAPGIAPFYESVDTETLVALIRAMSLSLFFTAMKVIPSILLERELKFHLLVVPEIVEVLSFQAIAITMALLGYEAWSFIIAAVVSRLLGAIVIYFLSPWHVGLGFDKTSAKALFKFGIPYQLTNLVGILKEAVTPIFVGLLLGAQAVGYLTWAATFAFMPLMIVQIFNKITFPVFSRIQHDLELLKKSVEQAIRVIGIFFFPIAFLCLALAEPIVHYVYTDKWIPGLPAFYLFALSILFTASITSIFFNAYFAVGKSKLCLQLMTFYMVMEWLIGVPLVYVIGFIGVPLAKLIIAYLNLPLSVYLMNRIVKINILKNITFSVIASAVPALVLYIVAPFLIEGITTLLLSGICGFALYLLLLWKFDKNLVEDVQNLLMEKAEEKTKMVQEKLL